MLRRSIVLAFLFLSPAFVLFGSYVGVVAVPVTTTTTQTTTTLLTLTGSGATTLYQTVTQLTSVQTVTSTTHTGTRVVAVPVQVATTVVRATAFPTGYGQSSGCTPDGQCTTEHYTYYGTSYVTQTGVAIVYSPSVVQTATTSQYTTSVPTTVFSTTASTSTYATGQVVGVTITETVTSIFDVQPPQLSISDMLSQNMLAALVLVGLVLAVLGFKIGRGRGRTPPPVYQPQPPVSRSTAPVAADAFCSNCGTPLKPGAKFCAKCGSSME